MTSNARTEAEEFLKLQEAATRAPWRYCEAGAMVFGPTDNEHIADAVIDIRGFGAGLPMDDNGRFVAHARNTALPRLTLGVVAENERLRELIAKLIPGLDEHWCVYPEHWPIVQEAQALQEPTR